MDIRREVINRLNNYVHEYKTTVNNPYNGLDIYKVVDDVVKDLSIVDGTIYFIEEVNKGIRPVVMVSDVFNMKLFDYFHGYSLNTVATQDKNGKRYLSNIVRHYENLCHCLAFYLTDTTLESVINEELNYCQCYINLLPDVSFIRDQL